MATSVIQQKPAFGSLRNDGHWSVDGLVFHTQFRPAGVVVDETAEKNHGTINGPTWVGNGLWFDGTDDYVQFMDKFLDGTAAFSIIVRATAVDIDTDRGLFYTNEHSGGEPLFFWMDDAANDRLAVYISTSAGSTGTLLGDTNLFGGITYTMAMTWDGTTVRAYVDGIEQGGSFPDAHGGTLDVTLGSYRIGADSELNKDFYGFMEYFSIYDRGLSYTEVLALTHNLGIVTEQYPAWWGMAPAAGGVNPKGPLGHPLYGPLAGPIAC